MKPAQLLLGCVVLGVGVGVLLTADLGSDGYSTLVNGVSRAADISFLLANVLVSAAFLVVASTRRVFPGIGTVVQVVVVGAVVDLVLDLLGTPDSIAARLAIMVAALPLVAIGIALYLGTQVGAGPAEAVAQAYDPPVPFRWSYSAIQLGSGLSGWALGASIGVGTVAVIVLLGPVVDLSARVLRQDLAANRTE